MYSGTLSRPREITIAHSPDSDDAFMFYGLATNKVRVPGLRFTHTLCDIETLNRKAMEGAYDLSAISYHAYPYVADKYSLMASGSSVGDGYGPLVVAIHLMEPEEIKGRKIAIPGTITPPAYSPRAVTTSNVVAVPKSTTMQGPPRRACAATALTMRSAPTS